MHASLLLQWLSCAILATQTYAAITPRSWDEAYSMATAVTAQMTLDEKIGVVSGVGTFTSRCIGNNSPVSRLGIPSLCMNDGPAGLRAVKNTTGFPSGINTASTFSRRLMNARGVALAEEFRGKGVNVFLGPAMDIMRNPKAGRNWESFGPDPYLTGEAAYETINGVQSMGVMACAKHFLANNQEHWRYGLSADFDDRTNHELYMYPYYRAVEADVASVMCAYNRINQTSACHNAALLGPSGSLRKDVGFKGFVVSDWGATHDSAADNANAGLDMEQPGDYILIGGGVYKGLKAAVNGGSVPTSRIDEMVVRILAPFYRLRQDASFPAPNFDAQHPDGTGTLNLNVNVRSDTHTALAREVAAASVVLLKNKGGVLPLKSTGTAGFGSAAIVGKDAAMPKDGCNLNECNDGVMVVGWGSGSYALNNVVPPVTSLTSKLQSVNPAIALSTSLTNDLDAGVVAARGKDVAFVFANAMSGELGFYDVVEGNMGDRNDLNLWWKGGSLIERVAAVNPNTVVIIHSVGPVSMSWSNNPNITAILYAGAPGEQAGPSLVDVLWGAKNPSGRLPFSMDDNESSYPGPIVYNSLGFPTINYDEKLLIDCRYMDANNITPRFPFGFGLSYTTFAYASLSISSGPSPAAYTVSFSVTNSGSVVGTEIPQMYLGFPAGAGEPKRVLRGFEEVLDLGVGQSRTVKMTLSQREISIWDVVAQKWTRPSGTFTVSIGASINDVRLTGSF
ncbi:glycoside hydrolase family 3 protein [Serendipita vermifera MAFF 305830]|uniref:beta-glucosidase n=1 Tax=Serendipita vermifera MAFF 305830 TaxID=933852 RepID=A0A0C3AVE9_SERVB|nr:glycoside hydrolase family 3 protein [Serendipita vermifera MAFF 305830]